MIVQLLFLVISSCFALIEGATDEGRIVGGSATAIEQYPYQVSLRFGGQHICGGSVISQKWILTAAHCIEKSRISDYTVRTGSPYHDRGGQINLVKQIIVHENFNEVTFDYDIAAVELTKALNYNVHTIPIPLPDESNILYSGDVVTVTGWGRLSSFGSTPESLRRVHVPLVSWDECAKSYIEHPISERMICAGDTKAGGKDACQGDSGGPLALNGKLVGIVSWGFGCAEPSYPGVYSRVTAYRDWIKMKTGL